MGPEEDSEFKRLVDNLYESKDIDRFLLSKLLLLERIIDKDRETDQKLEEMYDKECSMKRTKRWIIGYGLGAISAGAASVYGPIVIYMDPSVLSNIWTSVYIIPGIFGSVASFGFSLYNLFGLKKDYKRFKSEHEGIRLEHKKMKEEYTLLKRLYEKIK